MSQLTDTQLDDWARRLRQAADDARPIQPLTAAVPGLTVQDAYAIAERLVAGRLRDGARIAGRKIGLTSLAVQQQLGVSEPDYGALLDTMQLADGAIVEAVRYIAPRVELELAFHLREPLSGPGVTAEDVRAATAYVQPSFELVDSRVVDWRIALPDTVADNASSAAFVLGGEQVRLDDIDVTAVKAQLRRGDEAVETGTTSAVLGDPCAAVAWLANALAPFDARLQAGDVILSGACTRMAPARAGDRFVGDFGELGRVELGFA
ncbi:MAG TPA: 2-keto-4-pentenoate hydratase [Solirubrobacteraceae bacterium]|jgi:2-keto-4-pentenoate hydratase